MKIGRRELAFLLPAMAAGQGNLKSKVQRFEDLKVKENGKNRSRDGFKEKTHGGFPLDLHQTELAPGEAPHAAHRHEHEEVVMIREGTLEVTIEGKVTRVGSGSVVFVASNEFHGWRNVGEVRAHYFVMALGRA